MTNSLAYNGKNLISNIKKEKDKRSADKDNPRTSSVNESFLFQLLAGTPLPGRLHPCISMSFWVGTGSNLCRRILRKKRIREH